MRTLPRKLRPFRPMNSALESICPVSSLATAIPPSAPPIVGEPEASRARADQPVSPGTSATSPLAASTPTPKVIARPVAQGPGFGSSVVTTSAVSTSTAPTTLADLARYGNAITIATTNLPSNRSAPAPQDFATGGGGSSAAASSGAQPVESGPAVGDFNPGPASPSGRAAPAMSTPAGIRPMTMASARDDSSPEVIAGTGATQGGPVLSPNSGSGSGGPPPDMPPGLLVSGGKFGGGDKISPGNYNDPSPLPVGSVVDVMALNPAAGYVVSSATWSGGTNYSSYFSDDASNLPAATMTIGKSVQTNRLDYSFIVDSHDRSYTIQVNVVYTNGAKGTSQITFFSKKPAVTLTRITPFGPPAAAPNFYVNVPDANGKNSAVISYDRNIQPRTFPQTSGMRFQAAVAASPDVGGTLMFLQTITTQRFATSAVAAIGSVKFSINGQVALDDGEANAYGYPLDNGAGNSWPLPQSPPGTLPAPQTMSDRPYLSVVLANNPTSMQVGIGGTPEKYSTYLMYRSDSGGVWVALAELDWSWSMSASRPNASSSWAQGTPSSPEPSNATPPDIGPVWTTKFSLGTFVPA